MHVTRSQTLWLVSMLALGTVCIGLGRQLGVERSRTRLETGHVARLQARLDTLQWGPSALHDAPALHDTPALHDAPTMATSKTAARASPSAAVGPRAPVAASSGPDAAVMKRQRAINQANNDLYANPESRKLAIAETKLSMRDERPDLARQVRLSAEEEDQLLDLLANQMLKARAQYMQARATGVAPDDFEERQRAEGIEIAALIGTERYERYRTYMENVPTRLSVVAFQATLDDATALPYDDADRLIAALAGEHKRMEEKLQAGTGELPRDVTMQFSGGAWLKLDPTEPDAMVASAASQIESYDRNMARVAAPLLSAAQLKAFTAFQDQQRETQLAHVRIMVLNMQRRHEAAAKRAQPAGQ